MITLSMDHSTSATITGLGSSELQHYPRTKWFSTLGSHYLTTLKKTPVPSSTVYIMAQATARLKALGLILLGKGENHSTQFKHSTHDAVAYHSTFLSLSNLVTGEKQTLQSVHLYLLLLCSTQNQFLSNTLGANLCYQPPLLVTGETCMFLLL